jgi:hypothetical protein
MGWGRGVRILIILVLSAWGEEGELKNENFKF